MEQLLKIILLLTCLPFCVYMSTENREVIIQTGNRYRYLGTVALTRKSKNVIQKPPATVSTRKRESSQPNEERRMCCPRVRIT